MAERRRATPALFTAGPVERRKRARRARGRVRSWAAVTVAARPAARRHPGHPGRQGVAGAVVGLPHAEPAELHDGRRHLGAAGRHVLPGVHLAGGGRADRRAGRRLSERVRRRQLGARASSTWRWSTWPACRASCTRCSASARSCCSPAWAARCWPLRCTLAIMTLPVIITSTREALAAVPQSFREACWNMGASRWQTIRTIVLPNSISGILTGVILQVSRAAGETAPDPVHRRRVLRRRARPGPGVVSSLRPVRPLHGPVVSPVHHLDAGDRRVRGVCSTAPPSCSSAWSLSVNLRLDRLSRLPAVAQEVVTDAVDSAHRVSQPVGALRTRSVRSSDVTLEIPRHEIFGIIGPANSGKTTLLKCINRTIDFVAGVTRRRAGARRRRGRVRACGNVYALRRRIGMVFPLPVGLPLSVYDNVAYAPADGRHDATAPSSTRSSKRACGRPRCGTRSRTACSCWARSSPAGSSSG